MAKRKTAVKAKPKRKDIYDREIDRLVKMEFCRLRTVWSASSDARESPSRRKTVLFGTCGRDCDLSCGCPTQIVGRQWAGVRAATPALTSAIRAIRGVPSMIDELSSKWKSGTAVQRRKLLRPFAIAQRMTDKVLKKLEKAS